MRTQVTRVLFIAILLILALAQISPVKPVQAAFSAYDLVGQSKGMAPLSVDSALMGSAQGHSDYQASIGAWTHTGPGGSNPTRRAVAAGVFQVPEPTQPQVAPVITSTPNPDGSVIHVVGFGQTLIMIANAYGIKLDQLKKQNNLSGDIIFEGRKLLIQGSSTPTLTATITETPVPPTRTPRPTRTATLPPTITRTPTVTATATPRPFLASFESVDRQTLGTVIIALSGLGLVLVVVSFFRKKKN